MKLDLTFFQDCQRFVNKIILSQLKIAQLKPHLHQTVALKANIEILNFMVILDGNQVVISRIFIDVCAFSQTLQNPSSLLCIIFLHSSLIFRDLRVHMEQMKQYPKANDSHIKGIKLIYNV